MSEESTTPDLAELSRRMIEADSFDEWAMLAEQLYAPDAVWNLGGMLGSLEGFAAIRAFVMDYWLMWDDHHHHVEEIVDLGNGVMYVVTREHGRMKGSDAYVEAKHGSVNLLVEGRVVRVTTYTDIDEARAAAERLAQERGKAMSQANVEIVGAAWEAWERGDMEAIFALYDPAIVWDQAHYGAGELSGVYHGHDGIKLFFREWLAPFESYHAHAEEFIDAGEAVVVRVRQGGRGKQSGADVEMPPYWQVYRLRDGRVVRIEVYIDQAEALEAVGLAE